MPDKPLAVASAVVLALAATFTLAAVGIVLYCAVYCALAI